MNKLRKIFFISLLSLLLFLPTISFFEISDCNIKNYVGASELSHIKYAKAKDNCYLFRSSDVTNSNYGNVFFMVPKTYFVTILNKINSYIYKVQYKNKIGYVSSDSVAEVTFIPEKATLENVVFDTLDMVGTQIRTVPNAEDLSNIIMIIPAGSTGLNYISYIHGGVPSGGNSDVWYYAFNNFTYCITCCWWSNVWFTND